MPKEELTNRDLVIRYFLGTATELQRNQVEESLADHETFVDFVVIEDQLIYNFINGRLNQADSELFERNYLGRSRERRERVALAKTLAGYVEEWDEQPDFITHVADMDRSSWMPTVSYRGVWIPAKAAMAIGLAVVLAFGTSLWTGWQQRKALARLDEQRVTEHNDLQSQLEKRDQQIQRLDRELGNLKSTIEANASKQPQPRGERQDDQLKPRDDLQREEIARATSSDYLPEPAGGRGGVPNKVISIPRKADVTLILRIKSTKFPIYRVELQKEGSSSSPELFSGRTSLTRYGMAISLKVSTQTRDPGLYVMSVFGLKGSDGEKVPIESFRFVLTH